MLRIAIAIVVAASLCGCGLAARQEAAEKFRAAQERHTAESQMCVQQFDDSAAVAIARAKCLNAADQTFAPFTPAADLISLRMAKRLELSERRAAGKITFAQASLEFAELNSSITTEAQRRQNANMSAAAQRQSAAAATMSAINASSPRTCTRYGNSVTCF